MKLYLQSTKAVLPLSRQVLHAGCHNPIEFRVLGEVVHKRDDGIAVKNQSFSGVAVGHIAQLMGGDVQLFRQNLTVPACLIQHINEIGVLENVLDFP